MDLRRKKYLPLNFKNHAVYIGFPLRWTLCNISYKFEKLNDMAGSFAKKKCFLKVVQETGRFSLLKLCVRVQFTQTAHFVPTALTVIKCNHHICLNL